MSLNPFVAAINQLCDEKGLDKNIVLETVEAALAAAYRKEYGNPKQVIRTQIDPNSGDFQVWQVFEVVEDEEKENDQAQFTLAEAKEQKKDAKIGDTIEHELQPHSDFGRIAAQTAKQVIIQRIREAEREMLFSEFKDKEHSVINGTVQQIEGDSVIINLGRINAVMPPNEQLPGEKYYVGQRIKVYIASVEETNRGPYIMASRASSGLIRGLFAAEVPEIQAGTVEIKNAVREAGSRTKAAVAATVEGLDAVGSCVGQRATRIQSILAEIGDEKIDIIPWSENPETFIISALSPAKVESVELNKAEGKAIVTVPEDQLSLAIGKGGQNVRLASKLTGWSIDIKKAEGEKPEDEKEAGDKETEETATPATEEETERTTPTEIETPEETEE